MACKIDANLSGNDGKAMRIAKFFVEKGLTPTQACAICGNVYKESGYNETAVNKKSGAFGLFQYLPKYSKDLQSSPKKNDFDYQLDYTWGRYNAHKRYGDSNKGSAMYKKWSKTELGEYLKQDKGTLDDYVELWMCAFERCGVSEAGLEKRKKEARRVVDVYNKQISGDCAKAISSGSSDGTDNGSVDTDSNDVKENNGAVTDAVQTSVDCGSITVNGGIDGSGGGGASSDGSSGGGATAGSGFSGTVTNPKMKKILEGIDYYRNPPRSKNGKLHKLLPAPHYNGLCTYGPSTWYYNAGIDLFFWCGEYRACSGGGKSKPYFKNFNCIKDRMDKCGFYLAGHWDFEEARNLPTSTFRPGDVATLAPPCSAHGLMWTGRDWRSDCIEDNICRAYRSVKKGKFGDYSVCIWRRADCQEPQYQNEQPLPCTICK